MVIMMMTFMSGIIDKKKMELLFYKKDLVLGPFFLLSF